MEGARLADAWRQSKLALHASDRIDRVLRLLGVGGPEFRKFRLVQIGKLLAELVKRA
jgi:hypothetical protein